MRRVRSQAHSRRRGMLALASSGVVLTALASTALTGTASAATGAAVAYPGSVPSWATPSADAGAPAADPIVEGEIYLTLPNFSAAQQFALAVSTPGSSSYRKYLTPAAWIKKYAPGNSDVASVESYLTGQGLTITGVPVSNEYVVFRGPASVIDATFATSLHDYSVGGAKLLAPASAPKVSAGIASLIEGITLDQGKSLTRPSWVTPGGATGSHPAAPKPVARAAVKTPDKDIPPCSQYYDQNEFTLPKAYGQTSFPTNICGYTGSQESSAYGATKLVTSGVDGSGQTLAIVDAYASPTALADTQHLDYQTGSQPLTSRQYKDVSPPKSQFDDTTLCGGTAGWQEEQSLDIQASHGLAPGATVVYSGGIDCEGGLDLAVSKVLDNGLATVISNSYGDAGENVGENALVGEEGIQFQAAGTGIGLYYSSGDSGDEAADTGTIQPDFPASSPYVTAVGGTSLALGSGSQYEFETGWGDDRDPVVVNKKGKASYADPVPGTFYAGAGGGVSTQYAEPAYQKGVVPTALASTNGTTGRVVPDIAANADPYTGFLIGFSPINNDTTLSTDPYTTTDIGGTSLSSPTVAGEVVLAQAAGAGDIGFANPLLYAASKTSAGLFRDIVPPAPTAALAAYSPGLQSTVLVTLDRDSSLATAKGYDDVTGLGSPNLNALVSLSKA